MNQSKYIEKLLNKVNFDKYFRSYEYTALMKHLYNTRFVYDDMDYNRAEDALEVKLDGLDEPNFLEFLVSLVIRFVDDRIYNIDEYNQKLHIFLELLVNLNLLQYTDEMYVKEEIDEKLDRFMYRKYKYDGYGGLFPLKNPIENQRKTDIWTQMNSYINENYV